jgi:hypothetical protein
MVGSYASETHPGWGKLAEKLGGVEVKPRFSRKTEASVIEGAVVKPEQVGEFGGVGKPGSKAGKSGEKTLFPWTTPERHFFPTEENQVVIASRWPGSKANVETVGMDVLDHQILLPPGCLAP